MEQRLAAMLQSRLWHEETTAPTEHLQEHVATPACPGVNVT